MKFKLPAPHAEQAYRDRYVANRAPDGLGILESPFLTAREAALFCRFDSTAEDIERSFLKWARRKAVPARRRGHVLLFERAAILAALAAA